jgi:hypothetical protein
MAHVDYKTERISAIVEEGVLDQDGKLIPAMSSLRQLATKRSSTCYRSVSKDSMVQICVSTCARRN